MLVFSLASKTLAMQSSGDGRGVIDVPVAGTGAVAPMASGGAASREPFFGIVDSLTDREHDPAQAAHATTALGQRLGEARANWYYCLYFILDIHQGIWGFLAGASTLAGSIISGFTNVFKNDPETVNKLSLASGITSGVAVIFTALTYYAFTRKQQLARAGYAV
ncbi:MAG: hypothetical protein J0G29_04270 [Alphaproteobacteria bacterium]|nr:hypothetical protein [Alphaproteobacteria bacterium]